MKPEQANKIIAEYMGVELESFLTNNWRSYSESLDALVPVWEKLKEQYQMDLRQHFGYKKGYKYYLRLTDRTKEIGSGDRNGIGEYCSFNIKEAAAIATAKAIEEQE